MIVPIVYLIFAVFMFSKCCYGKATIEKLLHK